MVLMGVQTITFCLVDKLLHNKPQTSQMVPRSASSKFKTWIRRYRQTSGQQLDDKTRRRENRSINFGNLSLRTSEEWQVESSERQHEVYDSAAIRFWHMPHEQRVLPKFVSAKMNVK